MIFTKHFSISNRIFILILTVLSFSIFIFEKFSENHGSSSPNFSLIFYSFLFFVLLLFCGFWLNDKLVYNNETNLQDKRKIPFVYLAINSIFFSLFYLLTLISLFAEKVYQINNINISEVFFTILITFVNILLIYQLNSIFKQQTRPNEYIFKFLIKPVQRISNNYETVFSLKIFFLALIFFLPSLFLFFLINDILLSYFIASTIINVLLGGYWIGYGLYKYFVWVWGADYISSDYNDEFTSKTKKFSNLFDLKSNENRSIIFGFVFILFTLFLYILGISQYIISKLIINVSIIQFFLVFYSISLYTIDLNIIGKRSGSQPWYSNTFILYSFSIPFFFIKVFQVLFTKTHNDLIQNFISNTNNLKILFILIIFFSFVILIKTNNNYLIRNLWKDPYESNQLISSFNLLMQNPSINQLALLQKISIALDDKDTLTKIIAIYKGIIESSTSFVNERQINGILNFIRNQLELSTDDEISELLFELTHSLLDQFPEYAKNLYSINLNLFKNGNLFIKNNSLNALGHILQLDANHEFAKNLYEELKNNFATSDEKLKRLILDALLFFIQNFNEFNNNIQNFIVDRLEYEALGIATIMYYLLEQIFKITGDPFIVDLTKSKLESLDSPAKIGAITFLRQNFPQDENTKNFLINLLLKNLNDIDNAIGVRSNIIYTLNELLMQGSIEESVLHKMKLFIDDFDPDVKTAIVQSYSDQYLINKSNFKDLEEIFESAISDSDYIVRLVVLQSIQKVDSVEKDFKKKLKNILEEASTDESQAVKDLAFELLGD